MCPRTYYYLQLTLLQNWLKSPKILQINTFYFGKEVMKFRTSKIFLSKKLNSIQNSKSAHIPIWLLSSFYLVATPQNLLYQALLKILECSLALSDEIFRMRHIMLRIIKLSKVAFLEFYIYQNWFHGKICLFTKDHF